MLCGILVKIVDRSKASSYNIFVVSYNIHRKEDNYECQKFKNI